MGHETKQIMLVLRAYPDEWASPFSEELEIEAAQDLIAPVAPSGFALSAIAGGIELTWTNPTINVDGTTCNDLAWIAVYRNADSGSIDPDNPASYDERILVTGEAYTYPSDAPGTTFYFVITAIDRTGNESVASSELDEEPGAAESAPTSIPDDASGLIFNDTIGGDGVVSGHAMLGIAFNAPADAWVNFDRYRLWWQYSTDGSIWRDADGVQDQWTEIASVDRRGFLHKGLDNTGTKAYRYKATVVATDGTESSTADTAGGAATTADAADNTDVVAITIFAMNIVCLGEVTAPDISCDNLAAINADLGTITAGSMSADRITSGTLSASYISGGTLNFGAITRSALSVLNSELAGSIAYGKLAANSVRTAELYVDGNLNLSPVGSHYIFGCTGIFIGTLGASSYIGADIGGYLSIYAKNQDLQLTSEGNIAFKLAGYATPMTWTDFHLAGGAAAKGYITILFGATSKRLSFD